MVTKQPLVLMVDDEAGILRLLQLEMEAQGFRVVTASGGEQALQLIEAERPDIVLLDVLMPEMTGLEMMRRLKEHSNLPVILVTAKNSEADKVRGLELGADDYIVKPFSPEEVAARIRVVLRRSVAQHTDRVVRAGGIEIDLTRRLVLRDGAMVALSRTEWQLLQYLAGNAGKAMTLRDLLSNVWGPEFASDDQYARVWVSRLRHKLERDPAHPEIIKTVPGVGYVLKADAAATA